MYLESIRIIFPRPVEEKAMEVGYKGERILGAGSRKYAVIVFNCRRHKTKEVKEENSLTKKPMQKRGV